MTITCSGCPATWGSLSWVHCSGCHSTFTALAHFDAHRAGRLPSTGSTKSLCWVGWTDIPPRDEWDFTEVRMKVTFTEVDTPTRLFLMLQSGVWSTEEGHMHRRDLVKRAAIARAARGK